MKLIRFARSHALGLVALFIVLGGTAWALGRNSVGTKQLKRNAVTTAKIKNGAVTPAKLSAAARSGTRGPAGATGPTGATGPQGTTGPQGPGAVALSFLADENPGASLVQLGTAGGFTISADCTGTPLSPDGVVLRLFAQASAVGTAIWRQVFTRFGSGSTDLLTDQITVSNSGPTEIGSVNDSDGGDPSRVFLSGVMGALNGPMVNLTVAMVASEGAGVGACLVRGTAIPAG